MEKDVRDNWENPTQFILACVSYAVGLGNVWRFPYLCQMHGGGGFLIPYLIMLLLEGVPLFYLELAIGQKMRLGSIGAWTAISPYLGGLGYTTVVYFTATFPYVVLFIYLIRGMTLHGAVNGVIYMFTPKMEELAKPTTWINAATQIFFSLGLGFGSLIAFSSYNEYHNNFERQAIIVSLINSATSVFASIVTFAIYGFKATVNYENCLKRMRTLLLNTFSLSEDSITVDNVFEWVERLNITYPEQFAQLSGRLEECKLEEELNTAVEGTGLAFIVYSEAITNMPLPQLWSVLYFIMLLLLGMGSMLGNVTAIITPLRDFKVMSRMSNELFNGIVCVFCLLLGLGFTTTSGNYWFTMFNDYGATFSLLFIVLIEVITVSYYYGFKRFEKDIEDMLGHRPNCYIQGGTPMYQAWNKDLGSKRAEPA
ncbi:sodium- and chloride-dependent transporter XTRP3A [Nematolebias whitei]|uniref:sodium- and chloride-dependent transporter XTRP3A n=1 Tax=Nematolebias whitei TaxID=451745 RepID=UPI001899C368|nr:sodium- and chloride-dependent transporter XTRP3A [Nematolebias whitei]